MRKVLRVNFVFAVWLLFAWAITGMADFVLNIDSLLSLYTSSRGDWQNLAEIAIQPWLPAITILGLFSIEYLAWYFYFRSEEIGEGPFAFVLGALLIGVASLSHGSGPLAINWKVIEEVIPSQILLIYVGVSHLLFSIFSAQKMKTGLSQKEVQLLKTQSEARERASGISKRRSSSRDTKNFGKEIAPSADLQKSLERKPSKIRKSSGDPTEPAQRRTRKRPPPFKPDEQELVLATSLKPRKVPFT